MSNQIVCSKCGGKDEFCESCLGSGYDFCRIDTVQKERMKNIIDIQNSVFGDLRKQFLNLQNIIKEPKKEEPKKEEPKKEEPKKEEKEEKKEKEEKEEQVTDESPEVTIKYNPKSCAFCRFNDVKEGHHFCYFLRKESKTDRDPFCPFDIKNKKKYVF